VSTTTPSPAARPLRRDAELNRRRVLDAARAVFATRGLVASLDDVAHHAGLGVGTVYRRFPEKDALVEALFEERIRELVDLAERAATEVDPWDAVVRFLTGACERMAADRGLRDAVLCAEHGRSGLALARAELGPRLQELVRRARCAGRLRPDVETSDLVVLLKSVHVLDVGEAWRRQLAIALDGLCTARRHPTPLPGTALGEDALQAALSASRALSGTPGTG
jgi:AcrR family transcriptional regulator